MHEITMKNLAIVRINFIEQHIYLQSRNTESTDSC